MSSSRTLVSATVVQVGREPFGRVVREYGAKWRRARVTAVAGAVDRVAVGAEVARDLMADIRVAYLPGSGWFRTTGGESESGKNGEWQAHDTASDAEAVWRVSAAGPELSPVKRRRDQGSLGPQSGS